MSMTDERYVEIYDHQVGGNRRVPRREPELHCHCGNKLKVKTDYSDQLSYLPCVRCNATFYVIAHHGPFMETSDV